MAHKNTTFKVISRTICDCGKSVPKPSRYRKYCSDFCRNKYHNHKHYPKRKAQAKVRRGKYLPGKKQCLICKHWYVQVGSHIWQVHRMSAREYREQYDMPLKRGILPSWYREVKREGVTEEVKKNLPKLGTRTRYEKGDPRAKKNTGYKGRLGAKPFPTNEFYE